MERWDDVDDDVDDDAGRGVWTWGFGEGVGFEIAMMPEDGAVSSSQRKSDDDDDDDDGEEGQYSSESASLSTDGVLWRDGTRLIGVKRD